MSSKSRNLIRAPLKNTLLPKSALRAGNAGTINDNLGGTPESTRIAQDGFLRNLWKSMTVYGVDAAGNAQEKVVFTVDSSRDDGNELTAIVDDDSVDYVTRTDRAMGEALSRTKARFQRKGLRAHTQFEFTDEIARDPQRQARERAALGTEPASPPPMGDNYDLKPIAAINPARDKGQLLSIFWGWRRR